MAQGVSECVRGFSFMPENKVDVIDLQYIEGGELSRAWKMSRRERLKNIEAKIWEEFINERDMVNSVSSDDPYQFIEALPEDCMMELMDTELKKLKEETEKPVLEPPKEQEYAESLQEPRETMVTFAGVEDEQCDMNDVITILDDDDDGSEAGDKEGMNDSVESPCTVRENTGSPDLSPKKQGPEKPTDNVTNMLEASIYSAKVKELQSKLNLELLAVITTLEAVNLNRIDPHAFPKLQKQCAEFCARYCRIYLYPMSRQIHDITRHNNAAPAFARHTHIRSQLIRIVSLQQNLHASLQVFHKWFTQKTPLRECVYSLKTFTQLVRDADAVSIADLHNEELLQTCDNLTKALGIYLAKVDDLLKNYNSTNASLPRSGKSSRSGASKPPARAWGKRGRTKPESEARLSMYSLDKFPFNSKCSIGRSSGGTSKARILSDTPNAKPDGDPAANKKLRSLSRRPLMRAPGTAQRREKPRENDNITTLVEGVDISQVAGQGSTGADLPSGELEALVALFAQSSPQLSARGAAPADSPRTRNVRDSRGLHKRSPCKSPTSPKSPHVPEELKLALNNSEDSLPSVITVQCAKKDAVVKTESPKSKGKEADKEVDSSSDVTSLLRRLCAGNSSVRSRGQKERILGPKNVQLLCVNGGSPRQASLGTPQLLRILEETIQKQAPKPQFCTKPPTKDVDRYRLNFNTTSKSSEPLFQYRTKFVQHMLTSPMYANSAVGKPWEMIGNISEKIIDELLLSCAKEMQLENFVKELYKSETQ